MAIYYINDINEKLDCISDLILNLFNKHAPLRTSKITKPPAPWLTSNVKHLMKLSDSALTKFKQHNTPENWDSYKLLRNFTLTAIRQEKKSYLAHATKNYKKYKKEELFQTIN